MTLPGVAWEGPKAGSGPVRARSVRSARPLCGASLALGIAAASLVASIASPARAQSPQEIAIAKQTAGEGLAAYNAGEFDKAIGLFNQAKSIYPSAQILRMIGYSELALEHWMKAAEALDGALDAKVTPLAKEDRKDVEDQLAKATAHLGQVTIHCKGPGVKLTIDGGDAQPCSGDKSVRLVEGAHKLLAVAPDRLDAPLDLRVIGGKPAEVTLDPAPKAAPVVVAPVVVAPPPPPPPRGLFPHQREVGVGLLAGGVLAGIGSLVTVIEAAHWRNMANADVASHLAIYGQGCKMGDPRLCSYDISVTNNEASTANQLRNVAAGLGVTALVLGGAGIALIVVGPKARSTAYDDTAPSPPPPPVSLRCGPGAGSVSCHGSF